MSSSDLAVVLAGVGAWGVTAVLALVAVANWDPFWGFFPVLAAVAASWAIGEQVVRATEK